MLYESNDRANALKIQMLGHDAAELALDGRAKTTRLVVPGNTSRPAAASLEIRVNSIDLVGFAACTAGGIRLRIPLDFRQIPPDRGVYDNRL